MDRTTAQETADLIRARDEFVTQWGALGSTWGINRTMAQIHALLMVTPRALTTDEVMADLQISRGNAHANLRDLVGWGLVRSVVRKGERKEYFEAEKDVWKMFCTIVRERKRREVEPAITVLKTCAEQTAGLKSEEARAFTKQLNALGEFLVLSDNVMSKIAKSEQSVTVPWALKFLK
jgi:DNA-binding transcriptional regulator GbsR (MarR family)